MNFFLSGDIGISIHHRTNEPIKVESLEGGGGKVVEVFGLGGWVGVVMESGELLGWELEEIKGEGSELDTAGIFSRKADRFFFFFFLSSFFFYNFFYRILYTPSKPSPTSSWVIIKSKMKPDPSKGSQ